MKKLIIGYILGVLSCIAVVVIAESINSSEVLYDNSNSKTSNDNVQDALDSLYNIVDHSSVGFSLLERNPSKLSTELVAGLYRYQGVQDANNNVDNYICFGTTNKNTCTSDTDKYMYRIIGINTNGQMKLIKKEALNTAYQWNSSKNVDWGHSLLYSSLNGSYFLTNTDYVPDSTWSNRIATVDWNYGVAGDYYVTPTEMYNTEIGSNNIVSAKIGLFYLHDYSYSLEGGNTCAGSTTIGNICKSSWIHLAKNDSGAPNNNEWTITGYSNESSYTISTGGNFDPSIMTYARSVRPVFFLSASEIIVSGSGTLTNPYMLS